MGFRLAEEVWEREVPKGLRDVLTIYAQHANEDDLAWPGVESVAWKVDLSERQVKRILRELEAIGLLVVVSRAKGGRGKTTVYRVDLGAVPRKPELEKKGDTQVSLFLPRKPKRVTSDAVKGDTQMSPESVEPPSTTTDSNESGAGRRPKISTTRGKPPAGRRRKPAARWTESGLIGHAQRHWWGPDGEPPEGWSEGQERGALRQLAAPVAQGGFGYSLSRIADAIEGLRLLCDAGRLKGIPAGAKLSGRLFLGDRAKVGEGRFPLFGQACDYYGKHAPGGRRDAGLATLAAVFEGARDPP
jgi:hypothetical protein